MEAETAITPSRPGKVEKAQPPSDWQIIAESFEAMGKVGLAMTVGFSVAAAFCKLMDSGRLKMPSATTLLTQLSEAEEKR